MLFKVLLAALLTTTAETPSVGTSPTHPFARLTAMDQAGRIDALEAMEDGYRPLSLATGQHVQRRKDHHRHKKHEKSAHFPLHLSLLSLADYILRCRLEHLLALDCLALHS